MEFYGTLGPTSYTVADPDISFGRPRGAEVERRRREDRVAEKYGVWGGGVPSPENFFNLPSIPRPFLSPPLEAGP